jgi:exonuclease VII small subunit
MGLKRYIFKSGLDIVAPLKCGTRWLDEFNIEERIDMFELTSHNNELEEHIHSGTTFIWRPVREHFISAIQTEWKAKPNKDIWDIITEMEIGTSAHWHVHLYKKLYPLWLKFGFKFYKLRALSQLTLSASELKWTSNLYTFPLPIGHITVDEALKSLSPKQSIKIKKLIDEEENWLKLMIESQYGGKTGKEYLDLEDSMLETKCTVMDLEDKVASLENMIVRLEDTIVSLEDTLLKFKTHNIKLEDRCIELNDTALKMQNWNTKIKLSNRNLKDRCIELEDKVVSLETKLVKLANAKLNKTLI